MRKIVLILTTVLAAGQSVAADIASDIRNGGDGPDTSDGGYLEVGLAVDARLLRNEAKPWITDGVEGAGWEANWNTRLTFNGEFRFKGFFAEAARGSLDGMNLGYNVWNNDYWTVDLLASSGMGWGDTDNADIADYSEELRNAELEKRKFSYRGSGLRATGYFGDYIFQYRLLTDPFADTGVVSTARLGRSWQLGNWNLHGLASLRYDSARTNLEAYGITAAEATARYPEYRPGSGFTYQVEAGATYPISKNWVFRTTARTYQQSDAAKDSPLRLYEKGIVLSSSISYVFGE